MSGSSLPPRPSMFEAQLRAQQKRLGRGMVAAGGIVGLSVIVAVWLALRGPGDEAAARASGASAAAPTGASPSPRAAVDDPVAVPAVPAASGPTEPVAATPAVAPVASAPVAGSGAGVRATQPGTAARAPAARPAPVKSDGLTDAQRALLARMGGGDKGAKVGPAAAAPPAEKKTPGLSAAQLSGVVARGRPNLQRCYETALRGSGSAQAVRADISITVSAAGSVSHVSTSGASLPGMESCIARSVKTWRFPSASEPTETKFPIVFQPGS